MITNEKEKDDEDEEIIPIQSTAGKTQLYIRDKHKSVCFVKACKYSSLTAISPSKWTSALSLAMIMQNASLVFFSSSLSFLLEKKMSPKCNFSFIISHKTMSIHSYV